MKVGALLFPTEYSLSGPELVAEHSHIPKSTETELPRFYYDAMDPFVYLATAATVESRLLLGTGICLVIQRDPIQTAKLVASLNVVSRGRFVFGIGAGWNVEEMQNHGTKDASRRFKLMRERIEAMQNIWTEDVPEYRGEFVDFGPMEANPKPVQKPRPPILVGGTFPGAARRAIRYGDGWLPRSEVPNVLERIPEFRKMAEQAGRPELSVTVLLLDPRETPRFADAGADRILLGIPSAARDQTLRALDRHAGIAAKLA